ncbi:MAG: carboxypeptidase-like regulatory domain-containing protein [Sphingobacteriaceae bacterium]|nr:carboxypeptidase-like regulatory domain-containing protein [Sphingobacteriaceae bacterium]
MKKLLFSLMGLLLSAISIAQLKGRVVELDAKKNPSGLPNVIVQVKRGEFTVTDTSGNFSFIQAKKGDTLVFNLIGYKTEGVIVKDISKPITVVLSSGINLNEVEIEYRSSGTDLAYLSAMKIETLTERSLMKAACCNLSESFETNPSIDVNFADAVTGAKQIQMLGLSGQYAQITKENMPYMRGLA